MTDHAWVSFCRRTDDPKLAYIEQRLTEMGIPHRRRGFTWHAPLLEVPENRHEDAYALLNEVVEKGDDQDTLVQFDELEDDDSLFQLANDGSPYEPHDWAGEVALKE